MTPPSRQQRIQSSPQFRDGRFHNTSGAKADLEGNTLPIMRDFLFGGKSRRPKIVIPVENPLETLSTPPSSGLRLTWLGHSTLLIEIDGVRVLTDPVFGPRASPVSFAGPKRFHPAPVRIAELPRFDVVLLSHDHHDHLDPPSIRELARMRVPFITSLGVGARLERFGVDPSLITELDWWESRAIGDGTLTLTATPAQHFSGRGLFDRNKVSLWSSFVLATANRRIYFSADTGLTDELGEVGRRYGPFEISMIEIGAWHPAWGSIHLGPANALRALEMLGGGPLLPIHWATFDLGLHPWDEPIETLLSLADDRTRIFTPAPGRPVEPATAAARTIWWRQRG